MKRAGKRTGPHSELLLVTACVGGPVSSPGPRGSADPLCQSLDRGHEDPEGQSWRRGISIVEAIPEGLFSPAGKRERRRRPGGGRVRSSRDRETRPRLRRASGRRRTRSYSPPPALFRFLGLRRATPAGFRAVTCTRCARDART